MATFPFPLRCRAKVAPILSGKRFSFSLIVHTDAQAPLISFHPSSPILNVSADCPADHLVDFLTSEAGGEASEAASSAHTSRAREEALLEQVRPATPEADCPVGALYFQRAFCALGWVHR